MLVISEINVFRTCGNITSKERKIRFACAKGKTGVRSQELVRKVVVKKYREQNFAPCVFYCDVPLEQLDESQLIEQDDANGYGSKVAENEDDKV